MWRNAIINILINFFKIKAGLYKAKAGVTNNQPSH
jgi:hypothetical protein